METIVTNVFKQCLISRPTSVYGPIRSGRRMGLISAVVKNLLLHRVTHVTGFADTLRDYVYSLDIGEHVVQRVLAPIPSGQQIELLASGKPTALREIIQTVSSIALKPPYVRYRGGDNVVDITVNPAAVPTDWKRTPLEQGIQAGIRDYRHTFRDD